MGFGEQRRDFGHKRTPPLHEDVDLRQQFSLLFGWYVMPRIGGALEVALHLRPKLSAADLRVFCIFASVFSTIRSIRGANNGADSMNAHTTRSPRPLGSFETLVTLLNDALDRSTQAVTFAHLPECYIYSSNRRS